MAGGCVATATMILLRSLFLSIFLCAACPAATVFNVRDYGAAGNGITDDTLAIRKAIAAATAAGTGSQVRLPAGTYRYSDNIWYSGLEVYGDGIDATRVVAANAAQSAWFIGGTGPVLRDLSLANATKPSARSNQAEAAGVIIYNAVGFRVSNVRVSDTAAAAFQVNASRGTAAAFASLQHCIAERSLADAFHITNRSCYVDLGYNTATGAGDDMFAVVSYIADAGLCHDIRVHHNTGSAQTWGRGASVIGGEAVEIDHNTITASSASGICILSETSYNTLGCRNIYVHDNTVDGSPANNTSGQSGILVFGRADPADTAGLSYFARDVTVRNNTVKNSPTNGITIGLDTLNVVVEGNTVTHSGYNNVQIGAGAECVGVWSNSLSSAALNGVVVLNASADVSIGGDGLGNTINNAGYYAVYLNSSDAAGLMEIRDNRLSDCNRVNAAYVDAINVSSSSSRPGVVITDNQYAQTSGPAIERLIESGIALSACSNNTATPFRPSLYTLSGNPAARLGNSAPTGAPLAYAAGGAPTINRQPAAPSSMPLNSTVTLSVDATGSNLRYQWQKNGVDISDATTSSYAIAAVTSASTGLYRVTVSNTYGAVTSEDADVEITSSGTTSGSSTPSGNGSNPSASNSSTSSSSGSSPTAGAASGGGGGGGAPGTTFFAALGAAAVLRLLSRRAIT